MKITDVTTVSDRLDRIKQRLVILEGLLALLENDDTGDSVCADTSSVLLAARAQISDADHELTWLTEIQSNLNLPAPDDVERLALRQAGVSWCS